MAETLTASGTVHWIGSGLSTGGGVRVLCDAADRLVLWARSDDKARQCLRRLGLEDRATPAALSFQALADAIRPGDIVVSMLPAVEHAELLRLCIAERAHFACSSYSSPDLIAGGQAAQRAGTVVLS